MEGRGWKKAKKNGWKGLIQFLGWVRERAKDLTQRTQRKAEGTEKRRNQEADEGEGE